MLSADDTVLLAESKTDLQNGLIAMSDYRYSNTFVYGIL
jgi:hypothetical protein